MIISALVLASMAPPPADTPAPKKNDPAIQCVVDRVPAAAATDEPASSLAASIELRCEELIESNCGSLKTYRTSCLQTRQKMRALLGELAYDLIRMHRNPQ